MPAFYALESGRQFLGYFCPGAFRLGVFRAGKLLDDSLVESGKIIWLAAGCQVSIDNNLLIDPIGASILQVGLQRGPRRVAGQENEEHRW